MSVEVSNESGIDVSEAELVSVARFVIDRMDVNPAAELSMLLVDTAAMADLHMRWMDLPGPTDVMSFPMDELEPGGRPDAPDPGPSMLGDIVLCPEFAARQAAGVSSSGGVRLAAPAELTSTSIGPSRASTAAMTRSATSGSTRSAAKPITPGNSASAASMLA